MTIDQMMPYISLALSAAGGVAIVLVTRSRVERAEQDIRDLKADKASKEAVDSIRSVVADLRMDLDRRFDRIEGMLLRDRGGE